MFIATAALGGLNPMVTWRHGSSSSVNQTTYTASGISFGPASDRRWIVAAFRCTNLTANLSAPHACTIGGVSATLIAQSPSGTGAVHRQIWVAKVATGTSGSVSVTRAANMTGQVLQVWSLHDLVSGTPDEATGGVFGNPSTLDLDTVGRACVVALVEGTSSGPYTFTGLTEDQDTSLGTIHYAAASRSKAPSGGLSVSVSGAGSHNIIGASFH